MPRLEEIILVSPVNRVDEWGQETVDPNDPEVSYINCTTAMHAACVWRGEPKTMVFDFSFMGRRIAWLTDPGLTAWADIQRGSRLDVYHEHHDAFPVLDPTGKIALYLDPLYLPEHLR